MTAPSPAPATAARPTSAAPLVSVIIPVHNIAGYLGACLSSVARQTLQDFEVILVDDGSTDGTSTLCDAWAAQRRAVVVHQPQGGPSAARNAGLAKACGTYVAFVDGDDVVHEGYLSMLVEVAQQTGADVTQVASRLLGEGDRARYGAERLHGCIEASPVRVTSGCRALEDLLYQQPRKTDSSLWGKLFRREVLADVRLDEGVRVYEDLEVLSRLLLSADLRVAWVEHPAVYYYFKQADGTLQSVSARCPDALGVCRGVVSLTSRCCPLLTPAAHSRLLSVAFNMLRLNLSPDLETQCWQVVRELRTSCFFDRKVRWKNKAGIALSLLGRNVTKACFRLWPVR